MNVNGTSGTSVADIELLAKDSLYILIEVTADVMGAPDLLYTDSIVFDLQGNQQQDVQLVTLAKMPISTSPIGRTRSAITSFPTL